MSWKARADRIYEEGVVKDAIARLASSLARESIPFSDAELQTLAKRARESFYGSARRKERLERYKAHLSRIYGTEPVSAVASRLEEINNQIGWEEK